MHSDMKIILGGRHLGYNNGKQILPAELIKQIQQYVAGESIYIPQKEETKSCWGQKTDARIFLNRRNIEIYQKYLNGCKVVELSQEYHISTQGIYKIISKQKGK